MKHDKGIRRKGWNIREGCVTEGQKVVVGY